jgi:hypothetical protein
MVYQAFKPAFRLSANKRALSFSSLFLKRLTEDAKVLGLADTVERLNDR